MADLRDFATFCADVLRRPLWPHQLDAARSDAFITVIMKARRTGGTSLSEALAIWTAFTNRGCRVIVLSATLESARRVTESIGATLNSNAATRGAVVDDFATRIRLSNGSEIISLPASQKQVRGYGERVLLVILDEAGFMPDELWRAAHYLALDERANGSRILMLGTPWGGPDHFFRAAFASAQDGDPDHAAHHWPASVNPTLDAAYLERMCARVSPAEYAAEVLGELSDAVGSLIPRALLDRQTADLELPTWLTEPCGPARPILGLDIGVSFDRSSGVVILRLPGLGRLNRDLDGRPRFVVLPHIWPQATPLSQVVDDVIASPAPFEYLSIETSGVGAMPAQEIERKGRAAWKGRGPRRWNMVATTAAKKTCGYSAILGLLEQGRLVLPRHPDLLRQLAGLRFEQGARGFMRIEAEDAVTHDDVADALMLAALPHVPRRDGRVISYLSVLADPRTPIPDAPVPDLDEPIVATGGGLRVYKRPPLQSAGGPDMTLPAGVGFIDHDAEFRERVHQLRKEAAA